MKILASLARVKTAGFQVYDNIVQAYTPTQTFHIMVAISTPNDPRQFPGVFACKILIAKRQNLKLNIVKISTAKGLTGVEGSYSGADHRRRAWSSRYDREHCGVRLHNIYCQQ